MIVSRRDGALALVRQVEHGRVAGELAGAWGNATFERPAPWGSVRTATACHDDGWRAWDARVLYHEAQRRPLHFLEIEAGEHIRLYRQGLRRVRLADVYAGVLVGMHWTGLYRGRWSAPGASARLGRTEEDRRLQDRVVASEEARWVTAKAQAWTDDEPRSAFETRLWHNYELLQLWDLFSLYLSVMPQEPGPDGPAVVWGQQLSDLDHRPQPVLLPAVATRPGGTPGRVGVSVRSPGEATLDPFPFAGPVEVGVESVLVPDREWSHAELVRRVRSQPATTTTWRLVPPTGGARWTL